jgi:hypothetical protein
MIDQNQVRVCFTEITKSAGVPSPLARAGAGAAIGALADGGQATLHALRARSDVAQLRAAGGISPEEEKAFGARQRSHVGSRTLRGALVGGVSGAVLPHAAAAVKKYSGEAAQHLGREFGRGAAEHVAPAARAAMHEAAFAAPAVGRAAAAGAAEHVAPAVRAAMHEVASAAPAVGRAAAAGAAESAGTAGERAARGAVRGAKDALTPSWAGKLKGLATRLIKEE